MKLIFNSKVVATLTDTQIKVIQNDISEEIFLDDMVRRCKYWLESPVDKHIHVKKEFIISQLKEKREKEIPLNDLLLMEKFADIYPCPIGYEDIKKDITCKVEPKTFIFSKKYRKCWRKINQKLQENCSKEEYLIIEDKNFCDRMAWILQHKYEKCLERLKKEWLPVLEKKGTTTLPIEDKDIAKLIFSIPEYKNKSQREKEAKKQEHLRKTGKK